MLFRGSSFSGHSTGVSSLYPLAYLLASSFVFRAEYCQSVPRLVWRAPTGLDGVVHLMEFPHQVRYNCGMTMKFVHSINASNEKVTPENALICCIDGLWKA